MKHLKLFEEFNPYSGQELAKKLRILAEASETSISVSPITQQQKDFVFTIETRQVGDSGKMSYKVLIPFSQIEKARVYTYENGKKTFSANIEIRNENQIDVILKNFIETAQLYDDTQIEEIVENHAKLNSVNDVKKLLKTLVPHK